MVLARGGGTEKARKNAFRTVRPGRRRASEVMGTAGWRPQQLSRRARRTRSMSHARCAVSAREGARRGRSVRARARAHARACNLERPLPGPFTLHDYRALDYAVAGEHTVQYTADSTFSCGPPYWPWKGRKLFCGWPFVQPPCTRQLGNRQSDGSSAIVQPHASHCAAISVEYCGLNAMARASSRVRSAPSGSRSAEGKCRPLGSQHRSLQSTCPRYWQRGAHREQRCTGRARKARCSAATEQGLPHGHWVVYPTGSVSRCNHQHLSDSSACRLSRIAGRQAGSAREI